MRILLAAFIGLSVVHAATAEAAETEPTAADTASTASETARPAAGEPRGVIRLDETVISGNQELPKVLYILPWREPNGLPEIDLNAQYAEMDVFRPLYPPAHRRELEYFESLEPVNTVSQKPSEE
jgi:hypothetical protein